MEKQTYTREEFLIQQHLCSHRKRRAIFITVFLTLATITLIWMLISFLDIYSKKRRNERASASASNAQLYQLEDRNLYVRQNGTLVRLVPASPSWEAGGRLGRRWSWWARKRRGTDASEETRVGSVVLRDEAEEYGHELTRVEGSGDGNVLGREERRRDDSWEYGRGEADITDRQWSWEGRNQRRF